MIIVTGGAGFIGSNLVKSLSDDGVFPIVVDRLKQGIKYRNLVDSELLDYWDISECFEQLAQLPQPPKAIVHLGACSDTTEWDGQYMMENNYRYSCHLLAYAVEHRVPFIYASSAAVYGASDVFVEDPSNEAPLNVYGYSKLLFDQVVRRHLPKAKNQVVGLRYFNVYGPQEQHKGRMASVAFHCYQQLQRGDIIQLFEGSHGYADGEQLRDFVYVLDTIQVKRWLLNTPSVSGIFNVGTGRAQSFNDLANAVVLAHGRGKIHYIPFPADLKETYQSYTQADISALRQAGFSLPFRDVAAGVREYMEHISVATKLATA